LELPPVPSSAQLSYLVTKSPRLGYSEMILELLTVSKVTKNKSLL